MKQISPNSNRRRLMTEIDKWLYLHQSLTECTWGMLVMYRTHPVSHDQTQVCQVAKLLKKNMPTVSPWRWKSSPLSAKPYACEDFLPFFFFFKYVKVSEILTGKLGLRRQMDRLWWNRWPVVTQTVFKQRSWKAQWGRWRIGNFQTGEYIKKLWASFQQNCSIF